MNKVALILWDIVGWLAVLCGVAAFVFAWFVIPRWDAFAVILIASPIMLFCGGIILNVNEIVAERKKVSEQ